MKGFFLNISIVLPPKYCQYSSLKSTHSYRYTLYSQFCLFADQEYSQELKIQVEHLNKEKEDLLKQIQNKDELVAETQDDLRTFKRKSETIGMNLVYF